MSAHTQGPWAVGKQRKYRVGIDGEGWTDLAKVVVRMQCDIAGVAKDQAEGFANARLISAAPDMYEQHEMTEGGLVSLRRAIAEGDPKAELLFRIDDMLRETRAVIAKAALAPTPEPKP